MLGLISSKVTATGNVTSGPARLIAIHAICAGSAGSIVLKDASGGSTLFNIDTPASATAIIETYLGDEGMRFSTQIHATLTNATSLTCFCIMKTGQQPPKTKKYFRSTKSGAGMTKAGVAKYRRDNPGSR